MPPPSSPPEKPDMPPEMGTPGRFPIGLIVLALGLLAYLAITSLTKLPHKDIGYSQFKQMVEEGRIKQVVLKGKEVTAREQKKAIGKGEKEEAKKPPIPEYKTRLPEVADDKLLPLLEGKQVDIIVQPAERGWGTYFWSFFPFLLLLAFFFFMARRAREAMGGMQRGGFPFLRSGAKLYARGKQSTSYEDVAGLEHAKSELQEIVEFLKNPGKFQGMGATLPKGVLLMGPPGTGKTLLARATAGEADVPFYSISGSEFIEVFVGVGAGRVRDLFKTAKQNAPSIIFVDEIDAIGRSRGTGLGGGHDEREQTLNQILSEMDGFSAEEPVVVMAATNRPDVLDSALIRPGRFDRKIVLDLPQKKAREKILAIHAREVPIAKTVDLANIAAGTVGFSGADLKNLVNEAALSAIRHHRNKVEKEDFENAHDEILLGHEREEKLSEKDLEVIAFHESGHTLVAHLSEHTDPIRKVTIIPRGRALGATQQAPDEDKMNLKKDYIQAQIEVLLGGRLSEELIFGEVTTGAEDDLKRATALARKMVINWGMSEELGLLAFRKGEEHVFLGREIAQDKDYSEKTAELIDEAIRNIMDEAADRVRKTLKKNESKLRALAKELLKKETLEESEIAKVLG